MFDTLTVPFIKPNSNRYAHKDCAMAKEQETKDKEALEQYIMELFNIDKITPKIRKQINTYKTEYNYTYSGMLKTLKYFFEIKGNTTEKANEGIGIVGYVYSEANRYWRAIWEAQQKNKNINIEQYAPIEREVHMVSPKSRQPMRHTKKLFAFLEEGETK